MKAYRRSIVWILHALGAIGQAVYVQYNHLSDILFGVHVSTLIDALPIPVMLPMDEGEYYGDFIRYALTVSRPHFPLAKIRQGAIVRLYDGIPVPDEHGSYGMIVSLSTREIDVQAALCDVLRRVAEYRAMLKEVVV